MTRRWRLSVTAPIAAMLLLGSTATRVALADATDPPGPYPPVPTVIAYGYYCADKTTTCTEASGFLRYIGIEAYGPNNQRNGSVSPNGYFFDCGKFYKDSSGTIQFVHEWVWDKSWLASGLTQPQPQMTIGVGPTVYGDESPATASTNALGTLWGSASDPRSGDTASVLVRQYVNDVTGTFNGGTSLSVHMNGPLWYGTPTSHDQGGFSKVSDASVPMNCDAAGWQLFSHPNSNGWYPQMMAETTFESYDDEPNYPSPV